ncbi:MAG TPA: metal-sensitive transcriptional regulator [Clostridiales bacterium]|nr:metal-sensitive transcriptional regulator [Clostridiales bacterium]
MKQTEKPDIIRRLKIIQGQVASVQKMVEEDKKCEDILVQILAIKGAISKVSKTIIDNHIHYCITDGIKEKKESIIEELDEFSQILSKFI